MLINVSCPRCGRGYQLQESLRGKAMRCHNVVCKAVFQIEEKPDPDRARPAPEPARAPAAPKPKASPAGPLQFVEAEADVPEIEPVRSRPVPDLPLETVDSVPAWAAAPPVRKAGTAPAEPPKEGPVVYGPGDWSAPPPVRNGTATAEPEDLPVFDAAEADSDSVAEARDPDSAAGPRSEIVYDDERPKRVGRGLRVMILSFVVVSLLALGGGGIVLFNALRQREPDLAKAADEQYAEGRFNASGQTYAQLAKKFPDSESAPRYSFRQEISELRNRLADPPDDPEPVFQETEAFVAKHAAHPLMGEHANDLAASLSKLLTDVAKKAADGDLTDDVVLKKLDAVGPTIGKIQAVKLPKGVAPHSWAAYGEASAALRAKWALVVRRREVIERLKLIAATPSYAAMRAFDAATADAKTTFPDLPDSREVKDIRGAMFDGHIKAVKYVAADGLAAAVAAGEEPGTSILLDPRLTPAPGGPPGQDRTVLALARGVLYSLRLSTGSVKWAVRVGVDTTALPVRVPRSPGVEERFLVLSSDTGTLTAYAADAARPMPIWRYRLGEAVLGTPVVVEQRAYLATVSGEVHEIEVVGGQLLGKYLLGQSLVKGGTPEPGTSRIYFPADEGCVYAIDTRAKKCERILYSKHPSGSLRSSPIVVSPERGEEGGLLILDQADGLDSVRLRAFDLPLAESAVEKRVTANTSLPGWTWFRPHVDPEKIILLSDSATLGVFGVAQANNRDQVLFPYLGRGLDLRPLLFPNAAALPPARGRAEIVQAAGDDLWVLAAGRLQRLSLGFGRAAGPRLAPAWPAPQELGSPLHESQVFEDGPTNKLVLVTRPEGRSCVWVSCIDDDRGTLLWRRQLGGVAHAEPQALAAAGGPPLTVAADQSGAVFALDPAKYEKVKNEPWVSSEQASFLAGSLEDNPDRPPVILREPDGSAVHVLAFPGEGKRLVARTVTVAAGGRKAQVAEGVIDLPAGTTVAAAPALVGKTAILLLSDGGTVGVPLPLPAKGGVLVRTHEWRDARATADAAGFAVACGAGRFVVSDGGRGLTTVEWNPAAPVPGVKLPAGRANFDEPTLLLPERVTGLARLPDVAGKDPRLVVADATGKLALLEVAAGGSLSVVRSWKFDGAIGPTMGVHSAAAGPRLSVVVGRKQVAWIDPEAAAVAWTWPAKPDAAVVGSPVLVGDKLVVADQSGRYAGIDVATGKAADPGYALKGSIAPTASPVPFTAGRLLAPLSDGTLLLLPKP